MHICKKISCIFLTLGIFLANGTAVNAQSGSNKGQTRRQWSNVAMPAGTLTSPQLGAAHGIDGRPTGVLGRNNGKASASSGQARNSISTSRAPANPLLGAPKDYDERYSANLGEELGGKQFADSSEGYSRTPVERLLSPESATRVANYAGQSNQGKGLARKNTAASISYRASYSGSAGGDHGTIGRSGVYRSPW